MHNLPSPNKHGPEIGPLQDDGSLYKAPFAGSMFVWGEKKSRDYRTMASGGSCMPRTTTLAVSGFRLGEVGILQVQCKGLGFTDFMGFLGFRALRLFNGVEKPVEPKLLEAQTPQSQNAVCNALCFGRDITPPNVPSKGFSS